MVPASQVSSKAHVDCDTGAELIDANFNVMALRLYRLSSMRIARSSEGAKWHPVDSDSI